MYPDTSSIALGSHGNLETDTHDPDTGDVIDLGADTDDVIDLDSAASAADVESQQEDKDKKRGQLDSSTVHIDINAKRTRPSAESEIEVRDYQNDVTVETTPLLARSYNASLAAPSSEDTLFLFHAVEIENALNVIKNGFDVSAAKSGFFGKSLVLTESIFLTDNCRHRTQYSRSTNLAVFIVRTSLKHAYWRLHKEHIPPSISKNYPAVVHEGSAGERTVEVFTRKNVYPEYLVLYDRLYRNFYWPRLRPKTGY